LTLLEKTPVHKLVANDFCRSKHGEGVLKNMIASIERYY